MCICNKCGKQFKNKLALNGHKSWCGRNKKTRLPQPWNKGLTKETDERVRNQSKKISDSLIGNPKNTGIGGTKEIEKNRREKIRNHIIERYKNGWMPKAGRCKKIKYKSNIAGEVFLDGTWELKVAKYFDENELKWYRNTKKFQYINLDGKLSNYTPDFYVDNWNKYIEVKGYETELDGCKWSQFPLNLEVWKKLELKNRNIL